jgi:DNA-binding MarR family transcriptional regulator
MEHPYKNIRSILKSEYTLPILYGISRGYRPSQIAEQLRISPQLVNYYTDNLIAMNLIEKIGGRHGLAWNLTPRGIFILKQILSRSVNSSYQNSNLVPTRLHNLTFSFDIISFDESIRLRWKRMNNGVFKSVIKYPNHTLELTKSPNEGESVLQVHLSEEYVFDPLKGLIIQYNKARNYALSAAHRLRLNIYDNGTLIKKPHMAFEHDVIALYLATFQTAKITTKGGAGKSWIDASKGMGELETNDVNYAYKYLKMPENMGDIYDIIVRLSRKLSGYRQHYDPYVTDNN